MLDQLISWAVVILPTLFAVGLELISEDIRKDRRWRWGVMVFGLGLSALTWVQMTRAVKAAAVDRESAVIETSQRVSAQVSESVSKSVTKSVGEQYAQTINSLQTQIGSLQGQLAAQGKNVEAIRGSDVVSGKQPVRVEIANPAAITTGEPPLSIHAAAMAATANPQYGKYAKQFILTTNRVMNGGRVIITCKNKIKNGGAQIAGANFAMGGGGMQDENTYVSGIGAPNWSPDFPLVVTLYFDEDDLGTCNIKPLS